MGCRYLQTHGELLYPLQIPLQGNTYIYTCIYTLNVLVMTFSTYNLIYFLKFHIHVYVHRYNISNYLKQIFNASNLKLNMAIEILISFFITESQQKHSVNLLQSTSSLSSPLATNVSSLTSVSLTTLTSVSLVPLTSSVLNIDCCESSVARLSAEYCISGG